MLSARAVGSWSARSVTVGPALLLVLSACSDAWVRASNAPAVRGGVESPWPRYDLAAFGRPVASVQARALLSGGR